MELQTTNQLSKPVYDLVNKDSMLGLSNELSRLIVEKKLTTNIQGKNYVNVEGWMFCGSALGLNPVITEVTDLTRRGTEPGQLEIKYMAKCEVRNINTGQLVATGVALCSNFEHSKKRFDEYAILSMAQTRAIGKAYRNLLAWLMKAAGFEATPAEEMDFAVDTPKKPSKPVVEVMAEMVEDDEEIDVDAIKMDIAQCSRVKDLTDLYFTHKQLFDKDEFLKKLLTMKKESLTNK